MTTLQDLLTADAVQLDDVFDINDFTLATPWEEFIAELERFFRHVAEEKHGFQKKLNFRGRDFSLQLFVLSDTLPESPHRTDRQLLRSLKQCAGVVSPVARAILSQYFDVPMELHPIAARVGVTSFVLLTPMASKYSSKARSCDDPCASSPIGETRDGTFLGAHQGTAAVMDMSSTMLPSVPPAFAQLDGLMRLFRSKLPATGTDVQCSISVCHHYVIRRCESNPLLKASAVQGAFAQQLTLPFGARTDLLQSIDVRTVWPCLKESSAVENAVYSSLSPLSAAIWHLGFQLQEPAAGYTESMLLKLLRVLPDTTILLNLIEEQAAAEESLDGPQSGKDALKRLTKEPLSTDGLLQNVRRVRQVGQSGIVNLGNAVQAAVLQNLRTRRQRTRRVSDQSRIFEINLDDSLATTFVRGDVNYTGSGIRLGRGAPVDSLTYQLGLQLAAFYLYAGGLQSLATLWHEIVLELRYRVTERVALPSIEGHPDFNACLIHQKLQLINYCIQRQQKVAEAREKHQSHATQSRTETEPEPVAAGTASDGEDEFHDASDSPHEVIAAAEAAREPVGVAEEHATLKLLGSGAPLRVPETQEPGPLTEDVFKAKQEELVAMGSSATAQEARAHLQSLSLKSDMEAFKAANPGCQLADFVRWHSPKDWIVEEGHDATEGRLSSRFEGADNIWLRAWDEAAPVPVFRQRQLFDSTREAEDALHYLERISVGELLSQLFPCILDHSLATVQELTGARNDLTSDVAALLHASAGCCEQWDVDRIQELIQRIGQLERAVSVYEGLKHRLAQTCSVQQADQREALWELMQEMDRKEPCLESREYLIRGLTSPSGGASSALPQRMYAKITDNGFLLSGAFCTDATAQLVTST
ncbi:uncharacterized protein MONBRDRAFT_24227 [Monosiga brevicollis MX1]|uniref:Rab3 GTPase-activating protein catalytic subunit n=1 Tax=Monosiga brevicollis TaxID=81824 RepID=A9UVS6_MONBE|nr:uncharacterized protein MONBRDRAFT_24227 [Monosiga brevicollis MX1]EDQ90640.1 predicted protein [Monosiga brevicollis MX1]|eukprot:XP_001744691.1 hypothetical protein [Monosiga brevicollis MX1]